jgi:hypothetical protein
MVLPVKTTINFVCIISIHIKVMGSKLWLPTMQMQFSCYIILSFGPISFINNMIGFTVGLLLMRAVDITKVSLSSLNSGIPPLSLHSSL